MLCQDSADLALKLLETRTSLEALFGGRLVWGRGLGALGLGFKGLVAYGIKVLKLFGDHVLLAWFRAKRQWL